MDHPHHPWSPLPWRAPLRWPDDARLALVVLVLLEHYEWEPPEGTYSLRRPSGGFAQLPFPDYTRLTLREYGHRVGIFRVLDSLDRLGIPATLAVDGLTAEHYPWLVRHCQDRGAELIGHGVAATRLLTSRMGEDEERAAIAQALALFEAATGQRPEGWFSPEGAESARTPALLAEAGIRYVCDWPNDEQPYAMTVPQGDLVSLPPFLDVDDEFAVWRRQLTVERYGQLLVDVARGLHADGATSGRVLVVTLRPWLVGQPFRIGAVEEALGEIVSWPGVWAARGRDVVDWFRAHPPGAVAERPEDLGRTDSFTS
jgi:peptidoglycan/xylan/chitin deacetylase (PgdA/CDA1 family)